MCRDGPGRCSAFLKAGLRDFGHVAGYRPGHAPLCAFQARWSPFASASAHFLSFVPPLAAEHSLGFRILLLGATGLVVVCTAVIAVVALVRKVMTPAARLSHRHPTLGTWSFQILFLSRERRRCVLPLLLFALFFVVLVLPFSLCSDIVYALLLSLPCLGAPGRLDLSPPHLAVTYSS